MTTMQNLECPYLISNETTDFKTARYKCERNNMTLLADLTPNVLNTMQSKCQFQLDDNIFWVGLQESMECESGIQRSHDFTCLDQNNFRLNNSFLIQPNNCSRISEINIGPNSETVINNSSCFRNAGFICQNHRHENSSLDLKINNSGTYYTTKLEKVTTSGSLSTNTPNTSANTTSLLSTMGKIAVISSGITLFFLIILIFIAIRCRCRKTQKPKKAPKNINEIDIRRIPPEELQQQIKTHFSGLKGLRAGRHSSQLSTASSTYIKPNSVRLYANNCFIKDETKKSSSEIEPKYENFHKECSYFELFDKPEHDYENTQNSILPYASSDSLNCFYENTDVNVTEVVYDDLYLQPIENV